MATLGQIRTDLQTRLAQIAGLTCYDKIAESVDEPAAIVGMPDPMEYNLTYGPTGLSVTLPILLLVSRYDAEAAQETLDTYCAPTGATSVKRAVEDETVAITSGWHVAVVTKCDKFGVRRVGGIDYLGCEFTVEVVAT